MPACRRWASIQLCRSSERQRTRRPGRKLRGPLDEHVGHCVAHAAAAGDQNKPRDMVTEATQAIARIIKT